MEIPRLEETCKTDINVTMNSFLIVEDLKKSFGDIKAVQSVSFEVPKGETFGLLGPNGAGKSTTLSMLSGLISPDSGSVSIDGQSALQAPKRIIGKIGVAPQSLSLYEEMSAEENLAFFGKLFGFGGKRLKERMAWALDFARLQDRKKDRVKTFSGGMKRRLNMVCGLVHDPELILLDEPTVGVDPQSRNHIFDSIEKLKELGRTIIYTTHYMEEAERLCDRVAIIDHGEILAMDTVDQLISTHAGESLVEAVLSELPPEPASLPGKIEGMILKVSTHEPMEVVAKLVSSGVKIKKLKVDRADLESVFLNLTGRKLRDR